MLSDYNDMKLEINHKKKNWKTHKYMWSEQHALKKQMGQNRN